MGRRQYEKGGEDRMSETREFKSETIHTVVDAIVRDGNDKGLSIQSFTPSFFGDMFARPAIYFLMNGDECVYVGKTRGLAYRIGQHLSRSKKKTFTAVDFMFVENEDLALVEKLFITLLRPQLNVRSARNEVEASDVRWSALVNVSRKAKGPKGLPAECLNKLRKMLKPPKGWVQQWLKLAEPVGAGDDYDPLRWGTGRAE